MIREPDSAGWDGADSRPFEPDPGSRETRERILFLLALADDEHVARPLPADRRLERTGLRHGTAGTRVHRAVGVRVRPVEGRSRWAKASAGNASSAPTTTVAKSRKRPFSIPLHPATLGRVVQESGLKDFVKKRTRKLYADGTTPRSRHWNRRGRTAHISLSCCWSTTTRSSAWCDGRAGGLREPRPIRDQIPDTGDVLDQSALKIALEQFRPHEIYNLASVSLQRRRQEPVPTAEFAAVGVTVMLETVRAVDPKIRFYQASSSEIFGQSPSSCRTRRRCSIR